VWKNLTKHFRNSKIQKKSSLTLRIFFLTLFLLFTVCGFTYIFIAWATPLSFLAITSDELNKNTITLLSKLEQTKKEEAYQLILDFMLENSVDIVLSNQNGEIENYTCSVDYGYFLTNISSSVTVTKTYFDKNPTLEQKKEANTIITDGTAAYPFCFSSEDTVYYLTISPHLTMINQTKQALEKVLPALSLLILFISLIVSFFYSCYIARPIIRLSRISQKMADLDFSCECKETRNDEIGLLGQSLNILSNRLFSALSELKEANQSLAKDVERERELKLKQTTFFSAASHELKTPITILKGQLAGMLAGIDIYQNRDKYLARSLAVTNRMEMLVKEILTISRMEGESFSLHFSTFSLSDMLQHVIEQISELVKLKQQHIITEVAQECKLKGDASLLEKAVSNLLSNAVQYSPDSSEIHISLLKEQETACLTIENSDVHIPDDALPRLFDAFYRVETSRNRNTGGSGLGLFLVKKILFLHGYSCQISNTKNGVKAQVTFSIYNIPIHKTSLK